MAAGWITALKLIPWDDVVANAPAAVVNAVCNALGVRHLDMPLTSEKLWISANSS